MPSLLAAHQASQEVLSKLVAQSWLDEEFRKRFILEPIAVLEENGITLPSGAQVRVIENTSLETLTTTDISLNDNGVYEIPLPSKPAKLTDEQFQSWTSEDEPVAHVICI